MASISSLVSSAGSTEAGSDAAPSWHSNLSSQQVVSSTEKFENALKLAQASGTSINLEGPSALPVTAFSQTSEARTTLSDVQRADLSGSSLETVKTYGQMDAESLALENKRALEGVQFGSPVRENTHASAAQDNPGGIILDGWSRLRGIFDQQTASLNTASSLAISGTERLIATQIEVAKYSLLLDVTSKLTGKFTQSVDTLLKG